MMFSESSQTLKPFSVDFSRSRRLADVMKGTAYTRTVDSLADRQWNAHGGIPVTSKGFIGPQLNVCRTNPPQKSVNTVFPQVSRSVPAISPVALKEASANEDGDSYYNTWGSRCSDLDNKLQPQTRPSVVQPKRGVMMSRVARDGHERQIKTMRNFRSRNGTVRIIEPINPLPTSLHSESVEVDMNEDPVYLEHEQTSIVLKRIDEILHPAKMFFKSDLTSSEIEILSGESIACNHSGGREHSHSELPPLTGHLGRSQPRSRKDKSGMYGQSLALVVRRLAKRELDPYQKCQIWIDRCPVMWKV